MSLEEVGLLSLLLHLAAKGEPYGYLTKGGVPWTPALLSKFFAIRQLKLNRILLEIKMSSWMAQTEDKVMFFPWLVRKNEVRLSRAAGGIKGGNPALLSGSPKVNLKDNLQKAGKVNPLPFPSPPHPNPSLFLEKMEVRRKDLQANLSGKGTTTTEPKRVTNRDLKDNTVMLEMFGRFIRLGHVQDCYADKLSFFAMAEHAIATDPQRACHLFVSNVTKARWAVITQEDEDRAMHRIKPPQESSGLF
jgi:hypothetical protein